MHQKVYLDNSATTPIDSRVIDEMMPFLTEKYGNASSIHGFGQDVRGAVDRARHFVADILCAKPGQITFTSGGTEANNLAIRGFCEENVAYGRHVITSEIEHPSVANVFDELETRGFLVTRLPVYADGIVRTEDLKNAVCDDTILVSIMTANNEIGTIQPVREIGAIVQTIRESGKRIRFHTDAVQAVGKIPVNVDEFGCDLLSFSGHKIYAPKGIGALYIRRGVRIKPQNLGGHQERERRGGTENVPNIVAFGKACELMFEESVSMQARLRTIRDEFEKRVVANIPFVEINGAREMRLPNISNISFEGVDGEGLLINLDMHGIAVSTGSACSSGSLDPSPVILALGRSPAEARSAVRFSFGKENSIEELDYVLPLLQAAVENLRKINTNLHV
ncbi:MAG: cysteine desulfurase family protein [Pyrinomonadaceae bacterium]